MGKVAADEEIPGMLGVAVGIAKQEWPHTVDAKAWANEWAKAIKKNPSIHKDEGAMIGWFANAIMAGYDTARVQSSSGNEVYKYDEDKILRELDSYLKSTYGQHYVGKNNIQANDLVLAGDVAEARGFWKWNSIKYLLRYGKKAGTNRKDLLKAIHYAILLMYLNGLENKTEEQ